MLRTGSVRILNVGCGPVTPGVTPGIEMVNIDRRDHANATLEDMENLSYNDGEFDLVVCINALDHTPRAPMAVKEMIRVSKKWVYIDCALIQHTTSGRGHYWDMLEDGTMVKDQGAFSLVDAGFKIELIDNGMERRYNHVIATLEK